MIKLNVTPLDYEPSKKVFSKLQACLQDFRYPEMSRFDLAFLCGLLETHRPKKILEVGVASGATTSIILQVLEDLGKPYEMHSIDLNTNFYRDKTKPTGYMAIFAKANNLFDSSHSTLLDKNQYPLKNDLNPPPRQP